jgi:hypothetical protein
VPAVFVGVELEDSELLEVPALLPELGTPLVCEPGLVAVGGSRLGRFGM